MGGGGQNTPPKAPRSGIVGPSLWCGRFKRLPTLPRSAIRPRVHAGSKSLGRHHSATICWTFRGTFAPPPSSSSSGSSTGCIRISNVGYLLHRWPPACMPPLCVQPSAVALRRGLQVDAAPRGPPAPGALTPRRPPLRKRRPRSCLSTYLNTAEGRLSGGRKGANIVKLGGIWANMRPSLGQLRPTSADFGRESAKLGSRWFRWLWTPWAAQPP